MMTYNEDLRTLIGSLLNIKDGELSFTGYYETKMLVKDENIVVFRFNCDVNWEVSDGILIESNVADIGDDFEIYIDGSHDETAVNGKDIFTDKSEMAEFLNEIRSPDANINCSSKWNADVEIIPLEEYTDILKKETYQKLLKALKIGD